MADSASRQPLRYSWSHEASAHRLAVRCYNVVARVLPFGLKYGIGKRLRASRYPYKLVRPGSIVVQIGAPQDTLLAGRSRAMYFSLLSAPGGRVVVVEPDQASVGTWRHLVTSQGIDNVELVPLAAWSEPKRLTVYVDDHHPASNFSEGSKNYDAKRMEDYRAVELPADSLDNMLGSRDIRRVDLVSITTNGAEREILHGMRDLMATGLPHICLAFTGEGYVEMMRDFGYELVSHDDRGFTFSQVERPT